MHLLSPGAARIVRLTEVNCYVRESDSFILHWINSCGIKCINDSLRMFTGVIVRTYSCTTSKSIPPKVTQPLVRCKIFMIGDKLLSFFPAAAQESDVKEIHFHVDFKSIKEESLELDGENTNMMRSWVGFRSKAEVCGCFYFFFIYAQRTPEENHRLFWPQKHKFNQPLEQRRRAVTSGLEVNGSNKLRREDLVGWIVRFAEVQPAGRLIGTTVLPATQSDKSQNMRWGNRAIRKQPSRSHFIPLYLFLLFFPLAFTRQCE